MSHFWKKWYVKPMLWLTLPALVVAAALSLVFSARLEADRMRKFASLEEDFVRFQDEADPRVFFQRELESVFSSIKGLAAKPEVIDAVVKGLEQTWPKGSIDIHVFDGNGKLLPRRNSPREIQILMDYVRQPWTIPLNLTASVIERLGAVIPTADAVVRAMKGRAGKVMALGGGGTFNWGFHNFQSGITAQRIAGMVAFIHEKHLPRNFIVSKVLKRLNFNHAIIIDNEETTIELPTTHTQVSAAELKLVQKSVSDDRSIFNGNLIIVKRLEDVGLIVFASPDANCNITLIIILIIIYVAVCVMVLRAVHSSVVCGRTLNISMRVKLPAFFCFAFGFPLVLSMVLGRMYLADRREGIWEERRQEAFKAISTLDAGFSSYIIRRNLFYNRLCRRIAARMPYKGLDLKPFDGLYEDCRFDHMQIVASSGQVIRQTRPILTSIRRAASFAKHERLRKFGIYIERGMVPSRLDTAVINDGLKALDTWNAADLEFDSSIGKVAAQASQVSCKQYNSEHGISMAKPLSNADLVVEGIMEEDAEELLRAARSGIGKMMSISNGDSRAMVYFDVLPGPTGEAWYTVFLMHNLVTLEFDFLATLFGKASLDGYMPDKNSPLRIRAVSNHVIGDSFPKDTEHITFAPLLRRFDRSPSPVSTNMSIDGNEYLVCARPAAALKHYIMVGTVPKAEIEKEYLKIEKRVWGLATLLAAFGTMILIALWYKVVSPIEAVSSGLAAMRSGILDKPIPVTGEDELGRMCAAVNAAMERLKEMELAAKVQADLLPRGQLDLGGFVIQGKNRMTQAVGGDYFDFIPLRNGLTAVILGDVSGHGVSAALVTAMAKAVFTILCPRFPDQPEEVLSRLNKIMLTLLNRAKMMTCFLGILDVRNKRMLAANAGQAYPLLLPLKGSASFVDMPSQPLGTRSKAVFKRMDIDLDKSGLLLYSDGFVEAMSPDGRMFGYDQLLETATEIWCGKHMYKAPPETDILQLFFDKLQEHLVDGTAGDDVTLVIIRQRS